MGWILRFRKKSCSWLIKDINRIFDIKKIMGFEDYPKSGADNRRSAITLVNNWIGSEGQINLRLLLVLMKGTLNDLASQCLDKISSILNNIPVESFGNKSNIIITWKQWSLMLQHALLFWTTIHYSFQCCVSVSRYHHQNVSISIDTEETISYCVLWLLFCTYLFAFKGHLISNYRTDVNLLRFFGL